VLWRCTTLCLIKILGITFVVLCKVVPFIVLEGGEFVFYF